MRTPTEAPAALVALSEDQGVDRAVAAESRARPATVLMDLAGGVGNNSICDRHLESIFGRARSDSILRGS